MKLRVLLVLVTFFSFVDGVYAESIKEFIKKIRRSGAIASIYSNFTYDFGSRGIDSDAGLDSLKDREATVSLILTGNRLSQVSGFQLLDWHSLEVLKLENNHLVQLDAEILLLPKLKELNLSDNHLTALPEIVANNLKKLNVASNHLLMLPESIFKFEGLAELNIANNKMIELSNNISTMTSLKILILFDGNQTKESNSISSLPDSFKKLAKTLRELWVDGSKLDDRSKEILMQMQEENSDFIICKNAQEVIARKEELRKNKKVGTRDSVGFGACS